MNVLFLGGMRYKQPLDQTVEKKFFILTKVARVFVVGFAQDFRPRRFDQHASFYLMPRLPVPTLRYLTMFAIGPTLALWIILRHRTSALVAQSPYEGFSAVLAKMAARMFGRRVAVVIESHGDFEESLFLQRRVLWPWLYRRVMTTVAQFALRNADVLRAVSDSTRRQLQMWAPGKPALKFPTWTDIELFMRAGDTDTRGRDRRLILYAGALNPLKGVHFLLEAFAQVASEVPSASVRIIGKAESREYLNTLENQLSERHLEGRVEILDPLPQDRLARCMAQADVLVLPSISEGLGRVVFEAMACGTPVIGSRVGGIPEMIADGETGFLVPPGDVTALAHRLRWILHHPQEGRHIGRKARDFARVFFSQEAYVHSYMKLFEEAERILEDH